MELGDARTLNPLEHHRLEGVQEALAMGINIQGGGNRE